MATHRAITPAEVADRLAIRELIDLYAHHADRRDTRGQAALFTEDARLAVHREGHGTEATFVLHGREALPQIFAELGHYQVTTHLNGQSTVTLDGDRATGESYSLMYHLLVADNGDRRMLIASLRYLDTFVKHDGTWYFAERVLVVDWTESRPSVAWPPPERSPSSPG